MEAIRSCRDPNNVDGPHDGDDADDDRLAAGPAHLDVKGASLNSDMDHDHVRNFKGNSTHFIALQDVYTM